MTKACAALAAFCAFGAVDEGLSGAEEAILQRQSVGDQFGVVRVVGENVFERSAGEGDVVAQLLDGRPGWNVVGASHCSELRVETVLEGVVVTGLSSALSSGDPLGHVDNS